MTHKIVHTRRPRRNAESARVIIAHSSWSRIDPPRSGSTLIAPDDFWARLGL